MNEPSNFERVEFGWWIEVCTAKPICLYYFGCFDSRLEASLAQSGYLDDLNNEGAEIVAVQLKQCKPRQLTILEDELKASDFWLFPPGIELTPILQKIMKKFLP